VYGESPGDIRHIDALLEQPHRDPTKGEFARHHQARRARANHHNIRSAHDAGC
jgi:hypothetical protein